MVLTKKSENWGTMKLPHGRPQFPIDTKEKSDTSEQVCLFFIIAYKKKAILVHNIIKKNHNDLSIRTAERSFYLKKYSARILTILIIVLLNIYFFLGNYFLLAILWKKLLYNSVLSRKSLSSPCYTGKDTEVKHAQCLGRWFSDIVVRHDFKHWPTLSH